MTGTVSGLVLGGVLALRKIPGSCPSQPKLSLPGKLSSISLDHPFQMASISASANLVSTSSSPLVLNSSSSQNRTRAVLQLHSPGFMPSTLFSQYYLNGLRNWNVTRSRLALSNRCSKDLRRLPTSRKVQRAGQMTIRSMAEQSEAVMEDMIKMKNSQNAVVLYSKTWCPYCGMVKDLFNKLGVNYKAIELDELVEEIDVQDALARLTDQTTVPNVFIGGKHIGGCDDTMDLHERGELIPALKAAGAAVAAT